MRTTSIAISIGSFLLVIRAFAYGSAHETAEGGGSPGATTDSTLQRLVDRYDECVSRYDSCQYFSSSIASAENDLNSKLDSNSHFIKSLNSKDASRPAIEKRIEALRNEKKIVAQKKEAARIDSQKISRQYSDLLHQLSTRSRHLTGGHTIRFKGISYNLFVAQKEKHTIQLHWNVANSKTNSSGINDVIRVLKRHNCSPLMVTNAGMYNYNYEPQGLYTDPNIRSSGNYGYCNERFPLDMRKVNNDNFYLKPNGVFYIDFNGGYHVDTTEEFERLYNRSNICKYATQSGPMLVINGRIHGLFTDKSKNLKIRSGVGLVDSDHVVFIISNEPTNFYDFAHLFRDVFDCRYALFLDGAISKMYLKDINPNERGGDFGPMISVCDKAATD